MGGGVLMDTLFCTNNKKATCACKTKHLLYLSIFRGFQTGDIILDNDISCFNSKVNKLNFFS